MSSNYFISDGNWLSYFFLPKGKKNHHCIPSYAFLMEFMTSVSLMNLLRDITLATYQFLVGHLSFLLAKYIPFRLPVVTPHLSPPNMLSVTPHKTDRYHFSSIIFSSLSYHYW